MKHFNAFFLITLALPLSFLQAEDREVADPLSAIIAEESPLTQFDEELFFLEEEFETEPVSLNLETPHILLTPTESELSVVISGEHRDPETATTAQSEEDFFEIDSQSPLSLVTDGEPSSTMATFSSEEEVLDENASAPGITIDLRQAFNGSPIIYSVLIGMSICSVCLWLYSLTSIRFSMKVSPQLVQQLKEQLDNNQFSEALHLCNHQNTLLSKMLASGIQSRQYGLPLIVESMKSEAKRSTVFFWQKLGLLNDIAIIAPMLGLLGTVLGMFYAFYDVNRSIESISTLFDGLGISVGTTVAGLVVAIVALILHSTAKYRLVRALAKVENQAQSLIILLDEKNPIHKE